ncbi:DUF1998 domain-containing protein [Ruegeria arenilitoris]|uniref:DUF1998 domain-containing protein n=1 Tax=Ruegeria arenilitoris TaxID=1173585 RepID=UPI0020C2FFD4|nr:DUF1998 domain-containing protein [Ruegeria arenilitoris]
MSTPSLRRAQLISPFGVGALCEIDGQSFFVRGTRHWPKGKNLKEISLPSLTTRLRGVARLMTPEFFVPVTRFPRWHFCPSCRGMVQWTYNMDKREDDEPLPKPRCQNKECKGRALVPMRFVAICDKGHLDEIDWYGWAHRGRHLTRTGQCARDAASLKFEVSGKSGGDFKSMEIVCSCGAKNSLEGIGDKPLPQKCKGYQPGEGVSSCTDENGRASEMRMEPRGSSALHYASVISALDIARAGKASDLARRLNNDRVFQKLVSLARKQVERGQLEKHELKQNYFDDIEDLAIEFDAEPKKCWNIFSVAVLAEPGEGDDAASGQDFSQRDILGEEFPVLASPKGYRGASLICLANEPPERFGLDKLFERVVQVEKLREVRVLRGFQRKDVSEKNTLIPPDLGSGSENWLPAIEVSGEGIFLEFKQQALKKWLEDYRDSIDKFTVAQLQSAEKEGLPERMGFNANPVFILAHTFAHMLINQLSFDCGYSSTSLRERVYCGPESNLYAGVLIYTADSDAEGSMGGLVEMGAPDRIGEVIYRAVSRSEWCSGDPVCREIESQGVGGMNRAACHACSLVAETSCTFSNILLNRMLISGEGSENGRGKTEPVGYFSNLRDR